MMSLGSSLSLNFLEGLWWTEECIEGWQTMIYVVRRTLAGFAIRSSAELVSSYIIEQYVGPDVEGSRSV